MKLSCLLILTLIVPGITSACPQIQKKVSDTMWENIGQYSFVDEFGPNNLIFDPPVQQVAQVKEFRIHNNCGVQLDNLTVSITGNAKEFCLNEFIDDCPNTLIDLTENPLMANDNSPSFDVNFRALHPGKKKKRLSIDAVTDSLNDVSSSIVILGETEPRPQQ